MFAKPWICMLINFTPKCESERGVAPYRPNSLLHKREVIIGLGKVIEHAAAVRAKVVRIGFSSRDRADRE